MTATLSLCGGHFFCFPSTIVFATFYGTSPGGSLNLLFTNSPCASAYTGADVYSCLRKLIEGNSRFTPDRSYRPLGQLSDMARDDRSTARKIMLQNMMTSRRSLDDKSHPLQFTNDVARL
jgi:hypothetical protein